METINNLIKAFVGECQARNRYTFYAKIAKKEGYELVSSVFLETAEQEKVHAKRLFEHIQELKEQEEVNLEVSVPLLYAKTIENLKSAIKGENYEYTKMYIEFADVAEKEGFDKVAERMRNIAKAEEHHEERFKKLLALIEDGIMFKRNTEKIWICRECGYTHKGLEAPEECPSCDHPRAYYQIQNENY
jgi:rubrerythrin